MRNNDIIINDNDIINDDNDNDSSELMIILMTMCDYN